MLTKEQYIEFLISTPVNYTCTHLADHLSGISHDSITDLLHSQRLTAQYVLFDSWYASATNLKYIHRQGRIFYTTLKSNRLVSLTKEEGYIHLQDIDWTPERLRTGIVVKLKEVPFHVKLFKLVAIDGDID